MAEKNDKEKKDETKATEEATKKKQRSKRTKKFVGAVIILVVVLAYSPGVKWSTFGGDKTIDPRNVGMIHITADYPDPEHWIVTEPDERVDFQTVHNVDLEAAHNGIPVKSIFNAGGSENLAIGIDIGPRTNLTYRIIGGVAQTDLYYVKYRGQYPPRGWYEAALKNQ
jgi:hypothetical protein